MSIATLRDGDSTQTGLAPLHRLRRLPFLVWLALLWLLLMVFVAVFADALAPYAIDDIFLRDRLSPPGTPGYILGTDKLGRDIWTRLLYSIQLSMVVATLGTLIGGVLGTILGIASASIGGLFDEFVMLLVDFQASLPAIIFAVTLLAFFGNSLGLFIIVLGILGWEGYARLARGLTLSVQNREFVTAAHSLGAHPLVIYRRHILPNIASAIIVNFTLNFPGTILAEASLSFLGLGVQPPNTSLGLMLSTGREYLATEWWLSVIPGFVIFFTTLAIVIVGDWLRDVLDPMTAS